MKNRLTPSAKRYLISITGSMVVLWIVVGAQSQDGDPNPASPEDGYADQFVVQLPQAEGQLLDFSDWPELVTYRAACDRIAALAGLTINYDYLPPELRAEMMEYTTYRANKPAGWGEALEALLFPLELNFYQESANEPVFIAQASKVLQLQSLKASRQLARNNSMIEVNFSTGQSLEAAIRETTELAGVQLNMDYILADLGGARTSAVPQRTTFRTAPDKPMEWRAVLSNILQPFGYGFLERDGTVLPMSSARIKQELINENDARPLVRKVVPVHHADVNELIRKINEIGLHSARGKSISSIEQASHTDSGSEVATMQGAGGVQAISASGLDRPRVTPAIVVVDVQNHVDEIAAMIKRLDVVEQQVLIEVRILELEAGDEEQIGFNWNNLALLSGGITANSTWETVVDKDQAESFLLEGRKSTSTAGGTVAGQTRRRYDYQESDIVTRSYDAARTAILGPLDVSFVMDALSQRGDTELLSHPLVVIGNRSEAIIQVADEYPYVTVTRNVDDAGTGGAAITYTYEWETIPIGIQMWVLPEITPDGRQVRLSIRPQISDRVQEDRISPDGSTYPVVGIRQLMTRVNVPDGDTLLLGGLMGVRTVKATSKVPILGDIPILGRLFRHNTLEDRKSNLIFLITPSILDSQAPASGFEYMAINRITNLTTFIERKAPDGKTYRFPLEAIDQQNADSTNILYPPE